MENLGKKTRDKKKDYISKKTMISLRNDLLCTCVGN